MFIKNYKKKEKSDFSKNRIQRAYSFYKIVLLCITMNYKLQIYNQDELLDNVDKLDEVIDFVHRVIPDEKFDRNDFTKLYGNYALYKNIYMYYHNDQLIALSSCNFYNDSVKEDEVIVYLMVIAVDPVYQNSGIGSRFLKHILDMNNQSNVWIKIHKTNMQSQRFFKKNEFKKVPKKEIPSVLNPSYRKPYDIYVHKMIPS